MRRTVGQNLSLEITADIVMMMTQLDAWAKGTELDETAIEGTLKKLWPKFYDSSEGQDNVANTDH